MLEDPALQNHNRQTSSSDSDVFPPRSTASGTGGGSNDLPYNPDGMIDFWTHEYEAILNEVFGESEEHAVRMGMGMGMGMGIARVGLTDRDDPAWNRLDEIMRSGRVGMGGVDDDAISDSESVISVGELGQEARLGVGFTPSIAGSDAGSDTESESNSDINTDPISTSSSSSSLKPSPLDLRNEERHQRDLARQQRRQSGNENTWEHMSPTTLSLLPRSPAERRRSSSSSTGSGNGDRGRDSPLRAITLGSLNGGNGNVFEDEELEIPGPMPITRGNDDDREDGGNEFGAVDEVEYAYGE